MKIRVYYEDTDIGGVVYYANYFKFIERARSELFFANNINPFSNNGHFVVKNLNASFFASARLGDDLFIKTKLEKYTKASVTLLQTVYKDDNKLFECEITLVYVNAQAKPSKIDSAVLGVLMELCE